MLSDRECRLIRHLCEGLDWDEACTREHIESQASRHKARYRLQDQLDVSNVTEIRLWASPISDKEFYRLTGKKMKVKAVGV